MSDVSIAVQATSDFVVVLPAPVAKTDAARADQVGRNTLE